MISGDIVSVVKEEKKKYIRDLCWVKTAFEPKESLFLSKGSILQENLWQLWERLWELCLFIP